MELYNTSRMVRALLCVRESLTLQARTFLLLLSLVCRLFWNAGKCHSTTPPHICLFHIPVMHKGPMFWLTAPSITNQCIYACMPILLLQMFYIKSPFFLSTLNVPEPTQVVLIVWFFAFAILIEVSEGCKILKKKRCKIARINRFKGARFCAFMGPILTVEPP